MFWERCAKEATGQKRRSDTHAFSGELAGEEQTRCRGERGLPCNDEQEWQLVRGWSFTQRRSRRLVRGKAQGSREWRGGVRARGVASLSRGARRTTSAPQTADTTN